MKKQSSFILYSILIISILVGIIICDAYIKTNKEITEVYTLNGEISSKKNLNKVLDKCYYFNGNSVQFTSVGLIYPNPQIYQMYWVLQIANGINLKLNNNINVIKSLKHINFERDRLPELIKVHQITEIYKCLDYAEYDNNKYINALLKHYDVDSKMYYIYTPEDSINEKLSATGLAIKTFNNINKSITNLNDIKKNLIEMYNNDYYFDGGDILSNINIGGNIIRTLSNYEGSYSSLEGCIKDRKHIVKDWNRNIFNYISVEDPLSIFTIKNLIEINEFFGTNFIIPKKYLDIILKEYNKFEKTCGSDAFGFLDPQFLTYYLYVLKSQGLEYPFKFELNKYINDAINSNFCKNGIVEINIEDNFYGIALANILGYSYDKNKMTQVLDSLFMGVVGENPNITDNEHLKSIYYLLLSYKELGINYNDNKQWLKDCILKYLNGLNYNNQIQKDNMLDNFYFGIETLRLVDAKENYNKKVGENIMMSLNNFDIYKENNSSISKVYYLAKYIGSKEIIREVSQELGNSINNCSRYNYNQQIKEDYVPPEEEYIFYLFKIKNECNKITKDEKEILKKYLNDDIESNNLLGVQTNFNATTLKSIYYDVLIDKLLHEL